MLVCRIGQDADHGVPDAIDVGPGCADALTVREASRYHPHIACTVP